MGDFRSSVRIAAAPDSVWRVLADPAAGQRLFAGCTRAGLASAPPMRAGSRMTVARTVDGRSVEVEFDVVVFRPGKELELLGEAQGFRAGYRYVLRADGDGTRLDLDTSVEGLGFAALMEGVVTDALRKADADHLDRVRAAAEAAPV